MNDARRRKLEAQCAATEAEYRRVLTKALQTCADGAWGLFGQNTYDREATASRSGAAELDGLGAEIATLRERLGLHEPFALHARFQAERGRKHDNQLGEARLARAWLDALAAEAIDS